MAKMRWGNDIDWRGLSDAEYSEDDFVEYDGEIPPAGTILRGTIKKVWATESSNGDPMLKVLFEAEGNTGDRKEYNGLGIWDNVLFTMPQVKFKWQPFLDALLITLADLKNKTMAGDETDRGTELLRIGTVKFPVAIRVKTEREKYEGELRAKARRWLPVAEESDDEDDDFEEDDEFEEDDDEF